MLDLDDIAKRKQLAAAERESKKHAQNDARRAKQQLEQQRRKEIDDAERAGRQALAQVNRIEAKAQQALNQKIKGKNALADIARILSKPGIRTATGLGSQKAQKQTTRPKGANGAVSFHFSVTSISKEGELASVLKGRKSATTALSLGQPHQKYIEREDAAERVPAQQIGGAAGMQGYIEDPSKAEQQKLQDFEISSFGTIGSDPAERERFWIAVEEMEAKPTASEVVLDPTADPDLWTEVRAIAAREKKVPPILETVLATNATAAGRISTDQGLKLISIFQRAGFANFNGHGEEEGAARPISFVLGRGGRVQTRLVVELPHEMNPAQRLSLAREFCRDFEDNSLPFWAVIHAPNQHNDDRNFHLHVNLYDRPAKTMVHPETGKTVWDFEVVEVTTDKWWNKRAKRPYEQKKLRDVTTIDWVRRERQRFAAIANHHLAAAGLDKRLDPRRYEEMGVPDKARDRIPPASYARERKGLETKHGVALALEQWDTNREAVAAIAKADASYEAYRRAWLTQALQPQVGRQTVEAQTVVRSAKALMSYSARKAALVSERNAHAHVSAKVESRARLKPRKQRDEADQAAISVATEIKGTVDEIDRRIMLLIQQIKRAEQRMIRAKKIDDAALHAEQLADLQRRVRDMSLHLIAGPENVAVAQPSSRTAERSAPVQPTRPNDKARSDDLMSRVRAHARKIAEEREAAAAGQAAQPVSQPIKVPPPMSSAIEPRPLTQGPPPGTPVAANPVPPNKTLTEEERRKLEADKLNQLERRLAIARQRGRGRER